MPETFLVRYGAMAEIGRFRSSATDPLTPGANVVLRTQRGEELGRIVGPASSAEESSEEGPAVLRIAGEADYAASATRKSECEATFAAWNERIREWSLDLELVDIERTLDGTKLILYVLNDRGPETTKLALRAAAAGFGVIEVQPVGPDGLIQSTGGGCGSGGCGRKK